MIYGLTTKQKLNLDWDRYKVAIIRARMKQVPDNNWIEKLAKFRKMTDEEFDDYFRVNKWRKKFGLDGYNYGYWRNYFDQKIIEMFWERHLDYLWNNIDLSETI